jgi:hypothetical protein
MASFIFNLIMVKGAKPAATRNAFYHSNAQPSNRIWALLGMAGLELDCGKKPSSPQQKSLNGAPEPHTCVSNNKSFIPSYGDRHLHGEAISTAFADSTVN